MAADFVIKTGDMAVFLPNFQAAMVVVIPGVMSGSGKFNVTKMVACIDGDEANVMVPGCAYVAPPYVIPGVGMLKIDSLAGDQLTKKTKTKAKKRGLISPSS